MKKIISTIMLLAAAATAFTSCDKQNAEATPSPEESVLVFTSEKPSFDDDVKTEWNETEKTVYWSENDKIRVAYTVDGVWQKAGGNVTSDDEAMLYASTEAQSSNGFLTANFSVPNDFGNPISGNHKFYGLYPSNKVNSNKSKFTAPVVKINVNSAQALSSDTFDASADLMLGTSEEIQDRPTGTVPLRWNRLVAHAYITLADLKDFEAGEVVSSVTLTADSDAAMTGDFDLNITTGVSSLNKNNTTANVLTVNNGSLTVVEGDVVFWACMMPCTWKSLTVVVDTDKATYTREINLTGKEKTFLQNRRNLLTINMADAVRTPKAVSTAYYEKVTSAPADWSGTYLIVCEEAGVALTGSGSDASSIKVGTSVAISENRIGVSGDVNSVSIEKISDLQYLIQTTTGYYIYTTAGGTGLSVSTKSGTADDHPVALSFADGTISIIVHDKYLSYYNSSNFGFYTTNPHTKADDNYVPIQLYKRSENL